AARAVPDASTIVVERVRDELGDWRVCVLSPRGGRIHAPWAMAATAKIRQETGADVETLWGDDGFVVRFPDVDQPPDPRLVLRDLRDADAMDAIERQLQRLDPRYHVRSADGLHDLLLGLGDLSAGEILARSVSIDVAGSIETLVADRRAVAVRVAGDPRFIAVEDAARFRDALGVVLPLGLPESLLEAVRGQLGDLARAFGRPRAPLTAPESAGRCGVRTP